MTIGLVQPQPGVAVHMDTNTHFGQIYARKNVKKWGSRGDECKGIYLWFYIADIF